MKTARRLQHIEPFYVMQMAKAAAEIAASPACDPARGGEPMIFLNIGEPDFGAPQAVREAAARVVQQGDTAYTHATGLAPLREAISRWYGQRFGLAIDASRIVVTAGASAALQLATLALFEAGDEVLMPDPCYPCNRHFVAAADATARLLPSSAEHRFQLDAAAVRAAWNERSAGVLLASPSNPTGTSIHPDEMRAIDAFVQSKSDATIVDEIYLPLSYDDTFGHSALALGEHVISINSFSKYWGLTGWRLGWLVLPPALVPAIEKLQQNLYICASSVAQQAALAAFTPEALAECEARRAEFRRRRDFIVPALERLGFRVPVTPDGAFYVYADVSAHSASSWDFCVDMMQRAHVALTPGRDFGHAEPERWMRLSFANSMTRLEEAVARLARVL